MERETKVNLVAGAMLMLIIMAIATVVGLIAGLVTSSAFVGWVTAVVLTVGCPAILGVGIWWQKNPNHPLRMVVVEIGGGLVLLFLFVEVYVLFFLLS